MDDSLYNDGRSARGPSGCSRSVVGVVLLIVFLFLVLDATVWFPHRGGRASRPAHSGAEAVGMAALILAMVYVFVCAARISLLDDYDSIAIGLAVAVFVLAAATVGSVWATDRTDEEPEVDGAWLVGVLFVLVCLAFAVGVGQGVWHYVGVRRARTLVVVSTMEVVHKKRRGWSSEPTPLSEKDNDLLPNLSGLRT